MPQSPELAGGAGFTFEDRVAATYLAALLGEGFAPGIADLPVLRVAQQQRDFGEPLDDVVVDFGTAGAPQARLSLQVKTAIKITSAPSNKDFRDVVRDCWLTLQKPGFRRGVDRYGLAVGQVASGTARDLETLCERARASPTLADFDARFAPGGNASGGVRVVRDVIAALVERAAGRPVSGAEIHAFLAHFVLLRFDALHQGEAARPSALNEVRHCLANPDAAQATALWDRLCMLAREGAGRAAVFERPELVRTLSSAFRLAAAPSLRGDLERLRAMAAHALADIADDVDGVRLERPRLAKALDDALAERRWVQIRGLPGSGKSVLLRRRLEADLARGPALFLKADRLDGTGWAGFAAANRVSGASLVDLLVELAATGSRTIYIDGIDRVEAPHRAIVLDVVRAVMREPLLADLRIVVSARDTGLEPLRNWLGDFMPPDGIGTVEVTELDDEEAENLAAAHPRLRPLLFGPTTVRAIARRPFFAKILQGAALGPGGEPIRAGSEVDLVRMWWTRGGYDAEGAAALARQQAILAFAEARARRLSRPIALRSVGSVAPEAVDGLVRDGVLRHEKQGHSVQFAHDIFFEWAFFQVLDGADDWLEDIRACGEPPAVGRAVELLSQAAFAEGDRPDRSPDEAWATTLRRVAAAPTRSQWTRAWLLAPLASPAFDAHEARWWQALAADEKRFLAKALVWFQAERTMPNPFVLSQDLPVEDRLVLADLIGWPSDVAMWRRFIRFLVRRLDQIPVALYPDVVALFEVWQNAFAGFRNSISDDLLQVAGAWLHELDDERDADWPPAPSRFDALGASRESFAKSLVQLMLRAAQARPDLVRAYLERLLGFERLRDETVHLVLAFAPTLAQTHPGLLVDLTVKHLCQELPADRRAREREERRAAAERHKRALAKPPEERSRGERMLLEGPRHIFGDEFSRHDWERLCINDDLRVFFPASPLREPFGSLFKAAPDQALRLVNTLANHAITAWRQLHELTHGSGTPLPLEVDFPLGRQSFWGGDRMYLWFRGTWGPTPIASGYLAMETWALGELEKGRSADDVIEQLVAGSTCIATLGVAAAVALQAGTASETIFVLVTRQRLLEADHQRWQHDFTDTAAGLIGFKGRSDLAHIEAIRAINARPARRTELRHLVPTFYCDPAFRERTREAVLGFQQDLPFRYAEHRHDADEEKRLRESALRLAELVETENYRRVEAPVGAAEDEAATTIVHVSPSAGTPEVVARAEEAHRKLTESSLWIWAQKAFEEGTLGDAFTVETAIATAKAFDAEDLFTKTDGPDPILDTRTSAVAAAAAIALDRHEGVIEADLAWAREVLRRAFEAPEPHDALRSPGSAIPWHPKIFVARGLAADLRHGAAGEDTAHGLIALVAHPLEVVSLAALQAAFSLWDVNPKIGWSALHLALALCVLVPEGEPGPFGHEHSYRRIEAAFEDAMKVFADEKGFAALPIPPPPWEREAVKSEDAQFEAEWDEAVEDEDVPVSGARWRRPGGWFLDDYAAKVMRLVPLEPILRSDARDAFLAFLEAQLLWTIDKMAPPWADRRLRRDAENKLFAWTHAFGAVLGQAAGYCSLAEVETRVLEPLLALDDDPCIQLLAPFVELFICRHIYDSPQAAPDAQAVLGCCLDRLLHADALRRGRHRGGEVHGLNEFRLAKALMFVGVDNPAPLAARFANGDWSEIDLVLPLVDRFVRSAGWAGSVMSLFLTLCERARAHYPAALFADQVLHVMAGGGPQLAGWREAMIPARIAGLVQHLADRETPMPLALAQKLLRVLDLLVDMGDRRSAALQVSEAFREVPVPAQVSVQGQAG